MSGAVTCSPTCLVHKENLFQFCPCVGRAANSVALLVKHLGQLRDRLALPRRNPRRVQFVPARQLSDRLVALDRLKRHLGLELSRKPSPRPHDGSSSASANPP